MSAAGLALNHPTYREVGGNIADWLYRRSVMSLGDRADPAHPAYGLIGWNDVPRYASPATLTAMVFITTAIMPDREWE